jgi:hypothetical protein
VSTAEVQRTPWIRSSISTSVRELAVSRAHRLANREDTARESVREHVTGDEFWDRVWTVVALEPNGRLGNALPSEHP